MQDGKITAIGTVSADDISPCDVVVDASGTIAILGIVDSQVHVTFGDYTPRQKVVGYLEGHVDEGTTTSIRACSSAHLDIDAPPRQTSPWKTDRI
jgi:enamidase